MAKGIFHPDSGLMTTMTQVTDCIFLSLFFLLGCVPVVTVGASFAALYDASLRGMRKGDKHSWQRFWQVFRSNWKGGIVPTVLFFAAILGLSTLMISLWNAAVAAKASWGLFAGAAVATVVLVGVLSVLFPMLSRFDNSLGALLKNTVVLGLANLPRTFALGIVNVVSGMLCIWFVIPVFFLPALAALIGSFCIEPMFKPYMPEEETENG